MPSLCAITDDFLAYRDRPLKGFLILMREGGNISVAAPLHSECRLLMTQLRLRSMSEHNGCHNSPLISFFQAFNVTFGRCERWFVLDKIKGRGPPDAWLHQKESGLLGEAVRL